ncbi:MAG: nickel pincer cofactor biosynthesis protein LarB [Fuerstiella sp.]
MLPASDQILNVLARYFDDPAKCSAIVDELSRLSATASSTAEVTGAAIDLARKERCGFPEVIYGQGKPAQLIVEILQKQQDAGQAGFATRVDAEQAAHVLTALPNAIYHHRAKTLRLPLPAAASQKTGARHPIVAVVSAGSCDYPVAAEALETLNWMGVPAVLIEDVGVAGPQRLLKHVPLLQQMTAIVCVAGMEAALPSVLGGHVSCPVIGVPTSVGYGASLGGITALLSMLTCCASNVVAVNIDAGFRGGYVAGMIASGNAVEVMKQNSEPSDND